MTDDVNKRILGVAFDDNYLFGFLLFAFSIFKHLREMPEIRIANVNGTLTKNSHQIIEKFTSYLEIKTTIFEASLPGNLAVDSRISLAAYGRFWLADNISDDFVYIDTDSLVMPGWESIYDFLHFLQKDNELLLAALPALANTTPPWPINEGDKTQYRFHSGILVICHRNWTEHFANKSNPSWQQIAQLYEELNFSSHDQTVLQYAAQGKYLPIPDDFVNFATKYTSSTKIVTSGMWRKPWTIPKSSYYKYLNSLMMYQEYNDLFGVVKELELFSRFEDQMFEYLAKDPELLEQVFTIQKKSQNPIDFGLGVPFMVSIFIYGCMISIRKLARILKLSK